MRSASSSAWINSSAISSTRRGLRANANARPSRPDLTHDAGDLRVGPGARVDVGAAQLGGEQMPAAEDVQRQVAVRVVIAVEEAALLVPMDGIVRGVQVEDDLLGCPGMRLQQEVHEQTLDGLPVMADAVIPR